MKLQKIYRAGLQKYMYDEITIEAKCDLVKGRVLLTEVYIPPQIGYDEMTVDHLWIMDDEDFPKCVDGKKIQITGNIYAYRKGRNRFSYSITPNEIWLDKQLIE